MKFRGLDPRTRLLRWGLLAVALGIVLGATMPSALASLADAAASRHDSLPWYATRLLAFLSYFAISGSVVYGLLLSTKLLDAIAHRPISFALHQDLASVGLGLAAVHGMLLALDRSVPFSLTEIVVPFAAPYRPIWVGVGQLSLYLTAIVIGSFYVRRRIGQRAWRLLHYLTFIAFIGATLHGVLAGTDATTPWAWGIYVGAMVTVVFLLAYRIASSALHRAAVPSTQPLGRPGSPRRPREGPVDASREPGVA